MAEAVSGWGKWIIAALALVLSVGTLFWNVASRYSTELERANQERSVLKEVVQKREALVEAIPLLQKSVQDLEKITSEFPGAIREINLLLHRMTISERWDQSHQGRMDALIVKIEELVVTVAEIRQVLEGELRKAEKAGQINTLKGKK